MPINQEGGVSNTEDAVIGQKEKYIAVLTDGQLEQNVVIALASCGYKLTRESNYDGMITHHYVKQEGRTDNFKPVGDVS